MITGNLAEDFIKNGKRNNIIPLSDCFLSINKSFYNIKVGQEMDDILNIMNKFSNNIPIHIGDNGEYSYFLYKSYTNFYFFKLYLGNYLSNQSFCTDILNDSTTFVKYEYKSHKIEISKFFKDSLEYLIKDKKREVFFNPALKDIIDYQIRIAFNDIKKEKESCYYYICFCYDVTYALYKSSDLKLYFIANFNGNLLSNSIFFIELDNNNFMRKTKNISYLLEDLITDKNKESFDETDIRAVMFFPNYIKKCDEKNPGSYLHLTTYENINYGIYKSFQSKLYIIVNTYFPKFESTKYIKLDAGKTDNKSKKYVPLINSIKSFIELFTHIE